MYFRLKHPFLLLLPILLSSCTKDQNTIAHNTENEMMIAPLDTLQFRVREFNADVTLSLISNGTFTYHTRSANCFGSGSQEITYGTYKESDTLLELFPTSTRSKESRFILKTQTDSITRDLSFPYHPDSTRIKTRYSKLRWNQKTYLLSEEPITHFGYENPSNDFISLADYYNTGAEPKRHGFYFISDRKNKDSLTQVFPLEQIPAPWRKLFLQEPINAKITYGFPSFNTLIGQRSFCVQLDKGANKGVAKGHTFYANKYDSCNFLIVEVSAETSVGEQIIYHSEMEYCELDGTLTTQTGKTNFYY
ncbi:MAG: hypothetical protein AAFP76_10815 [Bacteroidota bacterium]